MRKFVQAMLFSEIIIRGRSRVSISEVILFMLILLI
jgi:hypothetical protein